MPKTASEYQREYRVKLKADPVAYADFLEADRLKQRERRKANPELFRGYDRKRRENDPNYNEKYRKLQAIRRAKDPEKHRSEKREQARLKRKRKLAAYKCPACCEICSKKFDESDRRTAAHWDHNHTTGVFRGWLCALCNMGLGKFNDNPEILLLAATYLRKHASR